MLPRLTTICGKAREIKLFFQKFRIPIGNIDRIEEGHPFLIARQAKCFLHKRSPLRLERLASQMQVRLLGSSAAFAAVTLMTRTDNVFPNRSAALRARDNVVEIEFLAGKSL